MAELLSPGDVIDGRFRLERVLGEGGMGQVFEATQLSVDRRVAIKTIRGEADSPVGRERFFREARALSALSHPGVVQLVDFGSDEESAALWIAMEFIEGLPLSSLLSLGRVRVDTALEVARQIASALSDAHAHGIVHRDLKPDNVMLRTGADARLQVKLVDFGIALPTTTDESKLTKTGAVAGTPYYMSPEQAQALEVGPPSDLYSLGVILFEMLVGQRPFQADTPLAVMLKHVSQPAPKLAEFSQMGFATEVEALVGALLEKAPADRPLSAEVVSDRIDAIGPSRVIATPNASTLPEFLPLVVEPTSGADDVLVDSETGAFGETLDSSSRNDEPIVEEMALSQPPDGAPGMGRRGLFAASLLGGAAIILAAAILYVAARESPDTPPTDVVHSVETREVELPDQADQAGEADDAGEAGEGADEPARIVARSEGRMLALEINAESNTLAWELSREVEKPAAPASPPVRPAPTNASAGPSAASPTFIPDTSNAMLKARQAELGFSCVGNDRCETVGSKGSGAAVCSENSTCKADCQVGGCLQRCSENADCVFECSGGGCKQFCGTKGSCKKSCSGGGCIEMQY